jgi:hypothetical protein
MVISSKYTGGIMTTKIEGADSLEVYDFTLTHADIVRLMNEDSVQLYNGQVLDGQVFSVVVTGRTINKERIISDNFRDGETITFRFRKVVKTDVETPLNDIMVP